jgi:hypothetical protein
LLETEVVELFLETQPRNWIYALGFSNIGNESTAEAVGVVRSDLKTTTWREFEIAGSDLCR